ncbi:hypothetical protein HY357_02255, partial [Candidatus Roizmanbacteria bacterium]|nr:hypothetical protein [Candidatus Roizmanbacteria bacterium]
GFDSYIDKLRSAERTDVLDGIKKGTVSPDNIGEAVEEATSKTFLNRMLARYIAKTFPSKFLRIDRDRFNEDGKSKWQKVRMALIKEELIKEELKWDPDKFDKVMKNLSLAESLLRQNVSKAMREQLKIVKEKEDFLGLDSINYELDAPKIRTLFAGKEISDGDLTDIIKVYDKINELYLNDAELDKFADSIGNEPEKFYTFTFGIEQTDLSFLLFKRAGPRTIPRAIGDIANMEQHMMNNGVLKLPEVLQQMAVGGGRGDFSPLVHVLKEVYDAYVMVHGAKDGYEAVHKLASAAIAYFKKDTMAKGILGLLTGSSARTNSIAAKVAGRGAAVWEWDATDIDKFVIALETNGLLKKDPYDLSLPGRYEPRYITPSKLPILNKIPFLDKIPLLNKSYKTPFTQRKVDYAYNGHSLREKFGGNWNHILQDFLLKYGPLFIAFLLYKFISESLKEAEGKKQ